MREINFESCIKYMAFVKELVGVAWLSKELETIKTYKPPQKLRKLSFIDYAEKFHPLAFLIYQADKQVKSCIEKKFFVSENILRLSYLSENLFILKNRNTNGLDKKIFELTSSNKTLFEIFASIYP